MRISRTGVGALALAFVLVSFGANMAFTQVVLPAENHYKVYNSTPILLHRSLKLSDAFGVLGVTDLTFDRFSTPAEKILQDGTDYPIINDVVHMDWWSFKPQPSKNVVIVTDQFGQTQWVVGSAVYLLTPSLKNVNPDPRGGPPPPVWNHYLCYDAIVGPLLKQLVVTLVDQFGNAQVVVLAAKYFCNPAEKNDGGKVYPIIDKTAHLACYQVDNPLPDIHDITTIDQFGFWKTRINQNDCLCVPALMDTPVPVKESTWGRVKALYRN